MEKKQQNVEVEWKHKGVRSLQESGVEKTTEKKMVLIAACLVNKNLNWCNISTPKPN